MPKVSQEHRDNRRRQIMDAAIVCFARDGFHRTTMQNLVRETGLSAGLFYRYFRSKEDIVAAIAEERHAQQAAALAAAAEQGEHAAHTRDILRTLATTLFSGLTEVAEQRWRRVTVQLWAEALRDDRVLDIVRAGLDEPIEAIAAILRDGQRAGTVAATLDPDAAARVCASLFQGMVLQQAWDPSFDVKSYLNAVTALIDLISNQP